MWFSSHQIVEFDSCVLFFAVVFHWQGQSSSRSREARAIWAAHLPNDDDTSQTITTTKQMKSIYIVYNVYEANGCCVFRMTIDSILTHTHDGIQSGGKNRKNYNREFLTKSSWAKKKKYTRIRRLGTWCQQAKKLRTPNHHNRNDDNNKQPLAMDILYVYIEFWESDHSLFSFVFLSRATIRHKQILLHE